MQMTKKQIYQYLDQLDRDQLQSAPHNPYDDCADCQQHAAHCHEQQSLLMADLKAIEGE